MDWRERDGVRWLEAALPQATAAFSTRVGGTSVGDFESLNLGLYTDDERVRRARQPRPADGGARPRPRGGPVRVSGPRGGDLPPRARALAEPVHGGRPPRRGRRPGDLERDADAAGPGRRLPPGGARGRATAWRCSIAAGAGSPPGSSSGGWGRCGRVGRRDRPGNRPLLLRGRRRGPGGVRRARRRGRRGPDARSAPRSPAACSPPPGSSAVESSGLCTSCEPELFFSHRRDAGHTGRQAGLVWIDG